MTTIAKTSATRSRHAVTLKKTIDTISTLTEAACISTVNVYAYDLDMNWGNYENAFDEHEKAVAGKDEETLEIITSEYATIHTAFLKAKIMIGKLVCKSNNGNATILDSSINQQNTLKTVKLPACKLTPFSGDVREWIEFKTTCRSMLSEQIADVQKLQFLKEALKGEPRELVSHVLPSDGAYERAMLLLKNRYENPKAIVYEHLRRLYTIPRNEPNKESIDTLRLIINTINGLSSALTECGIDVTTWDVILIYNTSQCLHPESLRMWEERLGGQRKVPALTEYSSFLETRITILEATVNFISHDEQPMYDQRIKHTQKIRQNHNNQKVQIMYTLKPEYKCVICTRNHVASRCDEFSKMRLSERKVAVHQNKLCFNCLQPHMVANCPFNPACRRCDQTHHTLLHDDNKGKVLLTQEVDNEIEHDDNLELMSNISAANFYHLNTKGVTILATAVVPVRWNGRSILLNTLIDLGATTNLITERACQMLKLPFERESLTITGIDNSPVGHITGKTMKSIGSVYEPSYNLDVPSLVVKRITDTMPMKRSDYSKWSHLHRLPLADPNFLNAHKIDLLLGASVYAEILESSVVKGKAGEPIAQKTKLGWIVFGPAQIDKEFVNLCHSIKQCCVENPQNDLHQMLKTFWEVEEVEIGNKYTPDEQAAEDIFVKSIKRTIDGKIIVDLPFRVDTKTPFLGTSREQAERRLQASQRRFSKNPPAKQAYDQNLLEYLLMGHMKELESGDEPRYFLPHHPVIKETSSTTKVRTVFDASAKTSNGFSLNDFLFVGPTIQPDLFDHLIRWRRFEYAMCGDIEKMYRQVWINPEHALFQCILWQHPDTNLTKTYKLLTVTFGTASAPFQAIRAVDEIGIRIQNVDPELAEAIRKNFYVDDFLGTTKTIDNAISLRNRVTEELSKYGFNLRKWKTNDKRIVESLSSTEKEEIVDFDTTFRTLGICWQPNSDEFQFKSSQPKNISEWTKRAILSEIAKLFDPLGWLAPCVVRAKILMQDVWRLPNKTDWNSLVPEHIATRWQEIYSQLCLPINIKIPRWIGLSDDVQQVEIHGFSDASMQAYAAVVYIKVVYRDNKCISNLLAAKTKLAPIKTISIPRLELCGAVLLAKLLRRCIKTLAVESFETFAWSDSMITLAWIAAYPGQWTTFVANRVSQIKDTLPSQHWRHVPTKQNPADIASRGALVQTLAASSFWWHGPEFLVNQSLTPKIGDVLTDDEIPEKRKTIPIYHIVNHDENITLTRFSSYTRLLRFTVYALRWRNHVKHRSKPIKAHEISMAIRKWVMIVQNESFSKEMHHIRHDRSVVSSTLQQLCPFIDAVGVLRMNGRVGNADIIQQKTAIILPAQHHFTMLLIRHSHEQVLHGGVQATLRFLREEFWIIHGRNQVKKLIHKCVRCFRYRKQLMKQKMSDLPSFRTEQSRPFAYVGCDYAGYFELKTSNRRNAPMTKGYIALFICLTTKAIHLELVADLSTAEFIMAFENFIARRGIPILLYTDNGTNFIGAAKEIHRLFCQMMDQRNAFTKLCAFKNIEFKTIPARASHMGGIWERAVGSVKYHLRRVLKDTKLNTRQFDYVLKQIEACLNSRPLWNISSENDDIEVLTPSHFFNFQAINTLPRPDLAAIPLNRLDQFQYLYRLYCSFWKTWSNEYLHQFQIRPKWHKEHPNAVVGQVVLIAEDNLPPSRWALGKITKIYPGKDELVRSVEVKCGTTTLRRPIHKLALLPTPENEHLELLKAQRGENVNEQQ